MKDVSRFVRVSAVLALSAASALAQNVISAKSGLVHYIEGDVTVDGTAVSDKMGTFAELKKDRELNTDAGRAEVLLTPGVFLRVGEQSSIRMLNTALADTRVEILSGNSMLEADTPMKDNLVTIVYKGYETTFLKHGLYEFQTSPAQLKVYSGEASVSAGGQTVTVHEGHVLAFTAALAQEHFDNKNGDSLYRWSKVRSEYISVANVSAAKSAGSGYGAAISLQAASVAGTTTASTGCTRSCRMAGSPIARSGIRTSARARSTRLITSTAGLPPRVRRPVARPRPRWDRRRR